jgi:stearoyl-CoA 9-desaturase NADPH oxidoreductase
VDVLTRVLPRLARIPRLPAVLTWPAPAGAYSRLVDPIAAGQDVRGRIERIEAETDRATTIVLRPGPGWRPHLPGQWVAVGVDVDGVRHTRCYSLTSVPAGPDATVSITVQAVPDGIVSNHLVHHAAVGEIVHLDGPQGDFVLPTVRTRSLLFLTGGSGITPVMGMLRALAHERVVGDSVLVHHAPSADQVIFADELEDLRRRHPRFRAHVALTGPGVPPPEARLTAERLDVLCPDWRRREAWACGPAPLLAAAEDLWATAEAPLHVERFAPVRRHDASGLVSGTVSFAVSTRSCGSDGATPLLELAESAGLAPAHSCRMGVCRRCVTPLRSGVVRDLRDGRTESEPGTHVQICVSAAVGDVELEL